MKNGTPMINITMGTQEWVRFIILVKGLEYDVPE